MTCSAVCLASMPPTAVQQAPPELRVLRLPAVEHKCGLKRSRIHELEAQGRFPRRIKISDRASGWLEHEIDAWLAERMAARTDV